MSDVSDTSLILHSDRAYLKPTASHVTILIPFWGPTPEDRGDPAFGRYDDYARRGQELFRMGSLEECDVAIFPQGWEQTIGDEESEERAAAFVANAKAAGKPAAVFFWSDSDEPVALDPSATVFRTSLYRSRRRPREFAQPAWSEDFVERYLGGDVPVREWTERPLVGFCGYAARQPEPATPRARLRRLAGDRKRNIEAALGRRRDPGFARSRALAALEHDADVDTNFVLREGFWAGTTSASSADARLVARREYVQNMVDSDYVVCARGGGNFSYRLYETLSCGRIPVFVDTDCVLPLESVIDWKDYCVWVDESELKRAGSLVAAFHASLSPGEFAERQRACRRLWETHLSPYGFFSHFRGHLE